MVDKTAIFFYSLITLFQIMDNDYYGYVEIKDYESYNTYYKEKIEEMNNR